MIELSTGEGKRVVIICSHDFRLQTGTKGQGQGEVRVVLDEPGTVTFTVKKEEVEKPSVEA
mgnify:CR=1